jgi:hypothetical protein
VEQPPAAEQRGEEPLAFGEPHLGPREQLHVAAARGEQFSFSASTSTSSASVTLPEFWQAEPEMWFRQAESAFRRAQVVDSLTKYDHVLTKLPEAVISSVRDLVRVVDDTYTDAYEQLKSHLLSSFGQSKWQLISKLIDHQDLGGRRPSSLMDQMLTLLPSGEKPGLLFISLFLRRLPVEYRDHLAAKEFSSPCAMAEYADDLWDAHGAPVSVWRLCCPRSREQAARQDARSSGSSGAGQLAGTAVPDLPASQHVTGNRCRVRSRCAGITRSIGWRPESARAHVATWETHWPPAATRGCADWRLTYTLSR